MNVCGVRVKPELEHFIITERPLLMEELYQFMNTGQWTLTEPSLSGLTLDTETQQILT